MIPEHTKNNNGNMFSWHSLNTITLPDPLSSHSNIAIAYAGDYLHVHVRSDLMMPIDNVLYSLQVANQELSFKHDFKGVSGLPCLMLQNHYTKTVPSLPPIPTYYHPLVSL